MFNLFKWSSTNNEIPQPPPLPSLSPPLPPTPPPSPFSSPLPGLVSNKTQSIDLISTLQRIEAKMDIILTKIDSTGNQRKKFTIKENNETGDVTKGETLAKKIYQPTDFVNELMKKVEERKKTKNMGASHGFSIEEAITFHGET